MKSEWWRNCALSTDEEIDAIDALEATLAPLDPELAKVRGLISALELCHHKAECWIANKVEAIGAGTTDKGLGTRAPESNHPGEEVWKNACAALSAWNAGSPAASVDLMIGQLPAAELLSCLGERSPLKEWQVQRLYEKIRSSIGWPRPTGEPYVWLLLDGDEYECDYRKACPPHYQEHREFWHRTARTLIRDGDRGQRGELSLALSLDKTIRLQLDPPADLRAISSLAGPDWIRSATD